MASFARDALNRIKPGLHVLYVSPGIAAFLPAISLMAFWVAGEPALAGLAVTVPIAFLCAAKLDSKERPPSPTDPVTGLILRDAAVRAADLMLGDGPAGGGTTAALAVGIDEFDDICDRYGHTAAAVILRGCADRLRAAVRDTDLVCRLDGARMGVVMRAGATGDLEGLIQIAARIQKHIHEPIGLDGTKVFASASVGFCAPGRSPAPDGEALIGAAEQALDEAASTGTGSIHAFTPDMRRRARSRDALSDDMTRALEEFQIKPWFQPQVDTRTGEVTGFEVLARWDHPKSGLVPPGEFLPAAEQLGLLSRLGETMLYQSLGALRSWDAIGCKVPALSLNFSSEELRSATVVDKIRWELDRFDVTPDRLTIEVLETVIAQTANDTIIRNLRALSEMGCKIDLDDFGTGHASITSIKRFSIDRIKVDRSFVTQIDTDADQQNIVSAILTLADRMRLDTLAEGVETPSEHAVLRRLGCRHIQGYGIARPMPFENVEPWLLRYRRRIEKLDAAARTDDAVPAFPQQE